MIDYIYILFLLRIKKPHLQALMDTIIQPSTCIFYMNKDKLGHPIIGQQKIIDKIMFREQKAKQAHKTSQNTDNYFNILGYLFHQK